MITHCACLTLSGLLKRIEIERYRSLRDVSLDLGRLTVVVGKNGSGKSNLYRALGLLQAAADGRFGRTLLAEGGMPSALYAGDRRSTKPVRLRLAAHFDDYSYELSAGVIQRPCATSPFKLDPEIKDECLWLRGTRRPSTTLAERGAGSAMLSGPDGEHEHVAFLLDTAESILAQVSDPARYPELNGIRRELLRWRFYHQFATEPGGAARQPRAGIRTDALASDGSDLGAAIATLVERGDAGALATGLATAFPGAEFVVENERDGMFEACLVMPGVRRPLRAMELSDGQLRFICLATALLSSRPPTLLVRNEPETSLHPAAIEALAPLILEAARHTQVWLTTHSERLRDCLAHEATVVPVSLVDGETRVFA